MNQIRQQLAYREENRKALEGFRPTVSSGECLPLRPALTNGVPTRFVLERTDDYKEEKHIVPMVDDDGASVFYDFSHYEELSWDLGTDYPALEGTWELGWTEVEGDRMEVASGTATLHITVDDAQTLWVRYANKDFPEDHFSDKEAAIVPGELYPDCGNDRWLAELTADDGDRVRYALTLLEDGTLLLQHSWELDGMPWVSYAWFLPAD